MTQEQLKQIRRKLQLARQTTQSVQDRMNAVRVRMEKVQREVAK